MQHPPGQARDACALTEALDAALRHVLARRPEKDSAAFSHATRCATALRDEICRQGAADRKRLDCANAVISVLLAGQFPLGKVPWEAIEAAATALRGFRHG